MELLLILLGMTFLTLIFVVVDSRREAKARTKAAALKAAASRAESESEKEQALIDALQARFGSKARAIARAARHHGFDLIDVKAVEPSELKGIPKNPEDAKLLSDEIEPASKEFKDALDKIGAALVEKARREMREFLNGGSK